MSDKTWNELLYNFRANLARANPDRYEHPKLKETREYLKNKFRSGIVYFAQHPNGLIKIGFTASPRKRFRELQLTEHPDIVLLGAIKASLRYEKRLHQMFASYRWYGEWFEPTKLLLIYINTFSDIETSYFRTL